MKATDAIRQIQRLVDINGDCELGVYLSFSKVTKYEPEIFYDDECKDICLGVYG